MNWLAAWRWLHAASDHGAQQWPGDPERVKLAFSWIQAAAAVQQGCV
jgi:hypothetical protein